MIFNTINLVLFLAVVEAAKAKAAGNASWIRAIDKAAEQIRTNPYICEDGDGLMIQSATGSEVYHANGACQCKAFTKGMACWHRAAAQLVKRYRQAEATKKAEQTAQPVAKPVATWPISPARSQAYYQRERAVRGYCVSSRAY